MSSSIHFHVIETCYAFFSPVEHKLSKELFPGPFAV